MTGSTRQGTRRDRADRRQSSQLVLVDAKRGENQILMTDLEGLFGETSGDLGDLGDLE